MPKTLNELAGDLKQLIIDLQSDAHNSGNIRMERYNNLKLLMFPQKNHYEASLCVLSATRHFILGYHKRNHPIIVMGTLATVKFW